MKGKTRILSCALRGRDGPNGRRQRLEIGTEIANAITTVAKDSLVLEIADSRHNCEKAYSCAVRKRDGEGLDFETSFSELCNAITTNIEHNMIIEVYGK